MWRRPRNRRNASSRRPPPPRLRRHSRLPGPRFVNGSPAASNSAATARRSSSFRLRTERGMRRSWKLGLCFAVGSLSGACGGERTAEELGQLQTCALDAVSHLDVGATDDSIFFHGIVDIEWVTDSTIVVAEATTLRLLSVQTGQVIETLGGEGDGPGEFRAISTVGVAEDATRVWAYDRANQRITRMSLANAAIDTQELLADGPIAYPSVVHILPDGLVVVNGETVNTDFSMSSDGVAGGFPLWRCSVLI